MAKKTHDKKAYDRSSSDIELNYHADLKYSFLLVHHNELYYDSQK